MFGVLIALDEYSLAATSHSTVFGKTIGTQLFRIEIPGPRPTVDPRVAGMFSRCFDLGNVLIRPFRPS
jgi:hypothetical protein